VLCFWLGATNDFPCEWWPKPALRLGRRGSRNVLPNDLFQGKYQNGRGGEVDESPTRGPVGHEIGRLIEIRHAFHLCELIEREVRSDQNYKEQERKKRTDDFLPQKPQTAGRWAYKEGDPSNPNCRAPSVTGAANHDCPKSRPHAREQSSANQYGGYHCICNPAAVWGPMVAAGWTRTVFPTGRTALSALRGVHWEPAPVWIGGVVRITGTNGNSVSRKYLGDDRWAKPTLH
jgi:hypothetical protein